MTIPRLSNPLRRLAAALLLTTALLGACAPQTPGEFEIHATETTGGTSGSSAANPNDVCRNPYWPIVPGAEWTYALSDGSTTVHRITAGGDGLFTLTIDLERQSAAIDGLCSGDGITLMGVPGLAAVFGGGTTITASNQEGLTLPDDIQQGDDWSQSFDLTADNGTGYVLQAHLESTFTAAGYETVTVPAGTFHALRIEKDDLLTISGSSSTTHSVLWYVQGVGNVRTEIEGTVIALSAYSIP